ncbi:hypothetical protein Golomagni_06436, partial [Golovinomyces magnicellulatus]
QLSVDQQTIPNDHRTIVANKSCDWLHEEDSNTIAMAITSFPTDVQKFDADDRISFSKLDNKFIAVDDDGEEYEFDAENKKWVLPDDETLVTEAPEASSSGAQASSSLGKRPHDDNDAEQNGQNNGPSKPNRQNKKQKAPPPPRQNTAVYVSGLPSDATSEEIYELFSRKAGVIAEEIDSGAPRIKMYNDAEGNFKGDALIVFFKPQSVQMAIMLLDDSEFRFTASGNKDGRITVQEADSSYKKTQYDNKDAAKGENGAKEKRPPQNNSDRQKIIRKTQKLDAKLADWDDDEPQELPGAGKRDKMVVLQHMFTLQELEEDPAALLEIKEDIRDECSKLGAVTSVVLYDEEVDGIVTVKFKDAESAMACINLMHGRSFDGRTVQAYLTTGKEKFKKSSNNNDDGDESN